MYIFFTSFTGGIYAETIHSHTHQLLKLAEIEPGDRLIDPYLLDPYRHPKREELILHLKTLGINRPVSLQEIRSVAFIFDDLLPATDRLGAELERRAEWIRADRLAEDEEINKLEQVASRCRGLKNVEEGFRKECGDLGKDLEQVLPLIQKSQAIHS